MLAAQRKALILEEVSLSGARRISELAKSLGVSEVTIRRDVEALADQGLVDKVHGGVTANSLSSTVEPPFAFNSSERANLQRCRRQTRRRNGASGSGNCPDGRKLAFTLWQKDSREMPSLTVVTNSVPVSRSFRPATEGRSDGCPNRRRQNAYRFFSWKHHDRSLLRDSILDSGIYGDPRHGH